MSTVPANPKHLEDLEQYELMIAAFPEKYASRDDDGDDLWDEVIEHFEEAISDPDSVLDLLARIVYLTMPMGSPLTGNAFHVIGKLEGRPDGQVNMMAAVSRPYKPQPRSTP